MKKAGIALLLVLLSGSIWASTQAKATSLSTRIGESTEDLPCKCIFDRNRRFNPEKIVWKNAVYKCAVYLENGACNRVEKVKDIQVE